MRCRRDYRDVPGCNNGSEARFELLYPEIPVIRRARFGSASAAEESLAGTTGMYRDNNRGSEIRSGLLCPEIPVIPASSVRYPPPNPCSIPADSTGPARIQGRIHVR